MSNRNDVFGTVPAQPSGSVMFNQDRWDELRLALRLTPRELDVVQGVFDDRSRAVIGTHLGISEHTVQTHLERIYRKVGVGSRCGLLVRFFAKHLELPEAQKPVEPGHPQRSMMRRTPAITSMTPVALARLNRRVS